MLQKRSFLAVAFALSCWMSGELKAAEPLKSGLQVGENITAIFEPLNVNGEHAGELHCLVCENGLSPVVMIFARKVSDPLVKLIAKIDAATAQNRRQEMGSFVVFLSDKNDLAGELKQVAKKQSLKHTILCIDAPAGPDGFNVSPTAEVTVVLYREHNVKANRAFAAGELTDQAVEKILGDVPAILTKKLQK
jgi:hypothetical protein